MKKSANLKKISALFLAVIMLLLSSCSAEITQEESSTGEEEIQEVFNFTDTTENVTKSETVYVNLDSTGAVKNINVSDWLHADKSQVYIKDTTTLKNFAVTKGQASSVSQNGEVIWQMNSSDIYYEGSSDKTLPVDISIRYFLDETEMTPEEIAGKSGNLRMEITYKNNVSTQVEINGEMTTIYAPVATLGGMILSYENFSNIEVTNGMSVGGGSYEVVVLAGVPGINESLNLKNLNISGFEDFSFSDTFTITATVTDFSMGDAYFALVPLSSLDLDIQMPKTIEDVSNILAEVQDIQQIIEQIDPNGVLASFMTDTQALKEMLDIMQKGLKVYNENEKMLKVMSEQLTPENIQILTEFLNSLDAEEMQSLMNMMSNVPALNSMLGSLMNLSEGLDEVMPILEGFSAALEDPEVAASLEKLPETLETLTEVMNFLNENKELLDVMSALMSDENVGELTGILDSMESGELNIGDADISQLPDSSQDIIRRMEQWLLFDYGIYTSAPEYMEASCMFICKTDPIKQ